MGFQQGSVDGSPENPSRRAWLTRALVVTAGAAGVATAAGSFAAPAMATAGAQASARRASQADWRFCTKCYGLFFRGYPADGACPAGGGHDSNGYNFNLPHDVPPTATAQRDWRFCDKCFGMFFYGYPTNGTCPTGGGHRKAVGDYDFVLPHDIPPTATSQRNWRFCDKCFGMFFYGYPTNGVCPAGTVHHMAGYDFVLPHL
ncbi:hypothetical protein SAMN04487983_104411 [Streptomyces sp. yr375]|uniref:hypothetical protein n=1 Tax=Streptomyces sp. yr375 TaxID=1761906 RepID=UPI0008CFD3B1|nr:hypothetical protein [Streptomyces sp. yr375]SES34506.1 hypothetical protein SAMN04487983_104411 [Streptomyces sp. yr375]